MLRPRHTLNLRATDAERRAGRFRAELLAFVLTAWCLMLAAIAVAVLLHACWPTGGQP